MQGRIARSIIFILVVAAVIVPLSLLWRSFAPLGAKVTQHYNSATGEGILRGPHPGPNITRIFQGGRRYDAMRRNSAFFEIRLPTAPKGWQKAVVKIRLKNTEQSTLFLGLKDRPKTHYAMKPLDHKMLNFLNWPSVADEELTLFQKTKTFETPAQFLDHLPSKTVVASYFLPDDVLKVASRLPANYKKSDEVKIINCGLVGSHTAYICIKDEPLNLIVTKHDLNLKDGADNLQINIYKDDSIVLSKTIDDDGIKTSSGESGKIEVLPIKARLRDGIYRMEFAASSDVVTDQLQTSQKLLVWQNKIRLAARTIVGEEVQPVQTEFYTDAKALSIGTTSVNGFQDVNVGGSIIKINEVSRNYRQIFDGNLKKIVSPSGDLTFRGPGFFAFSPDSFFVPVEPRVVEFDPDQSIDYADYILTSYRLPQEDDAGWQIVLQEFDLSQAYIRDNIVRFKLLSPGLKHKHQQILIDYIQVELTKPSSIKAHL